MTESKTDSVSPLPFHFGQPPQKYHQLRDWKAPPGGCGTNSQWLCAVFDSGGRLWENFVAFPFLSSSQLLISLSLSLALLARNRRYRYLYSTRISNEGPRSEQNKRDVEYQQQILVQSREPFTWHASLARCREYSIFDLPLRYSRVNRGHCRSTM